MTRPNELPTADELLLIERRAQAMRAEVMAHFWGSVARAIAALPQRLAGSKRHTAHS